MLMLQFSEIEVYVSAVSLLHVALCSPTLLLLSFMDEYYMTEFYFADALCRSRIRDSVACPCAEGVDID